MHVFCQYIQCVYIKIKQDSGKILRYFNVFARLFCEVNKSWLHCCTLSPLEVSSWQGERSWTGEFERMKIIILFLETTDQGKYIVKMSVALTDILLYFKQNVSISFKVKIFFVIQDKYSFHPLTKKFKVIKFSSLLTDKNIHKYQNTVEIYVAMLLKELYFNYSNHTRNCVKKDESDLVYKKVRFLLC